jgi:hypothetical protein
MGTKKSDKQVNYSHKLAQTKLVNAWLGHFWCMDEPQANMDS